MYGTEFIINLHHYYTQLFNILVNYNDNILCNFDSSD